MNDKCRTIHDLSCQFGARGFTEEMREAVGTTQEGLTDFLQSFPSLFTVDGDQVSTYSCSFRTISVCSVLILVNSRLSTLDSTI